MPINQNAFHKVYPKIYKYLQTKRPNKETRDNFLSIAKEVVGLISKQILERDRYISDDMSKYNEAEDNLVKMLFLDVIKTKDSELLIKVAELWFAIINEGILHLKANTRKTVKPNTSFNDENILFKIISDKNIYMELSNEIGEELQFGFFESFGTNVIYPLIECFYKYSEGKHTDFDDNIPIISAITKFGNMVDPEKYVKVLIAKSDATFSGAAEDKYRKDLGQLLVDLEILRDNEDFIELENLPICLNKAFSLLEKNRAIESSISEFVAAYTDNENRTIIKFSELRNRAEAGIIVRTFNTYYFDLPENELNEIELTLKNNPYQYKGLIPIIKQYEDTSDTYDERNLDERFIKMNDQLILILKENPSVK